MYGIYKNIFLPENSVLQTLNKWRQYLFYIYNQRVLHEKGTRWMLWPDSIIGSLTEVSKCQEREWEIWMIHCPQRCPQGFFRLSVRVEIFHIASALDYYLASLSGTCTSSLRQEGFSPTACLRLISPLWLCLSFCSHFSCTSCIRNNSKSHGSSQASASCLWPLS